MAIPVEEVAADIARVLLGRVGVLTDALVAEIVRTDPAYVGDGAGGSGEGGPVPGTDLWRSCHDNIGLVLRALAAGRHDVGGLADDAPRITGRRRAEQGLPLDSLLHAYRLGGRLIWEAMVAEARRSGHAQVDALLDVATTVWELVDDMSSAVADSYRGTRADLSRRDELRRQLLFDALVDGAAGDPVATRDAAESLGLPERGHFVAVVGECGPGGAPPLRRPEQALAERGARSAWRVRGARQVGLVVLGSGIDPISVLGPLASGRVGVSPAFDGLGGAPRAVRLADAALVSMAPGSSAVASLDDHLVEAVVVSSPELGAHLARRVLGSLLELEEGRRTLLVETFQAWLDAEGSLARAAISLYCHRNTVLNRLRRLEALTGRSLGQPRHVAELILALVSARLVVERPQGSSAPPARASSSRTVSSDTCEKSS
ncbi:MAG: PucR family transcriptional regulator [Acidimicrobiales bacterium]